MAGAMAGAVAGSMCSWALIVCGAAAAPPPALVPESAFGFGDEMGSARNCGVVASSAMLLSAELKTKAAQLRAANRESPVGLKRSLVGSGSDLARKRMVTRVHADDRKVKPSAARWGHRIARLRKEQAEVSVLTLVLEFNLVQRGGGGAGICGDDCQRFGVVIA